MMAAADDLKKAEEKLADPNFGGPYEFEGKEYTLSDLRDVLVPLLTKRAAAAEKRKTETQAGAANFLNRIRSLEKRVREAQEILNRDRNAFRKNNLSRAELAESEKRLEDAKNSLAQLTTREPAPTRRPTPITQTGAQRVDGPVLGPPSPFLDADGNPIKTDEDKSDTVPADDAATFKVTKTDVDAALVAAGLPDTPANRKKIREDLKAGKKPQADWETLVAQRAGEYAYLLDPKFEGLPELLRKAVEKDWFDSPEGEKQFLQEFAKTPYALNADANQEKFDLSDPGTKRSLIELQIDNIRSQYGEIQFDQTTLEEVATTAARNKSTNIELGRLVYRAAFKRGAAEPAFGESVAAKTALGGGDVARVRAIYRAYGQTADDQQIARILAGDVDPASGVVMTEDMLRNNLRDIAKVSYKPFADLLDRGISVETIFQPYKQIAASVLEKTPDEVELVDASGKPSQFASALMMKEPMSLTDWITTLKSDERYGWQFTSEAKQQATSLVMDLEKAFGFRA
jgi:hypothetical protein